jgi:hypothetical protein
MPAISVIWEVKTGRSLSQASLGKVSLKLYLKNKLKTKVTGAWLK